MASGSNITATGMVTMQQVVAGTDLVLPADFNNARTNMGRLLDPAQAVTMGTFTLGSTYGYGQGGAGVGVASTGANVLATGASGAFKDLQDDVQATCAFLGVGLRTGVGTDVTTATTITAATWNNLMLNIRDCWNARFAPASRTLTTDASVTRTTVWTNTLTQITTWTFSSAAVCRGFFNGGGRLGVSASRTGGTANNQNTAWTNSLSAIGDIFLTHDTTVAGAGTIAGIGFYELTAANQQLVIYYGAAAPYSNDYIRVLARTNSTTAPTQVIITTELVDADDGVIDESVGGALTINARRAQPDASGSGFSFAVPTDNTGTISGS